MQWRIFKKELPTAASYLALSFLFCLAFYGSPKGLLITIPAAALLWFFNKQDKKISMKKEFSMELRDGLTALKGRISGGASLENAFSLALKDLQMQYKGGKGAIIDVFNDICSMQQVNIPMDECLLKVSRYYRDEYLEGFVNIVISIRERGGDVEAAVKRTIDRITEKLEREQEAGTAVAGKKKEFLVMKAIPVLILIYLRLLGGDMTEVLYKSFSGKVAMTICLMIYISAWLWGRKILEF